MPRKPALNATNAAKKINAALKQLRKKHDHADLVCGLACLANHDGREAFGVDGSSLGLAINEASSLKEAAVGLLQQRRNDRFELVCHLLDQAPRGTHGPFWLSKDAACQFAAMIGETEKAHFINPLGLRPWLELGVQRAAVSAPTSTKSIHLSGVGPLERFADELRKLLTFKTISTAPKADQTVPVTGSGIDFVFPEPSRKTPETGVLSKSRASGMYASSARGLSFAMSNSKRRTILMAPPSTLTKNTGEDARTRAALVDTGRVTTVIYFPSGILGNHVKDDHALITISPQNRGTEHITFLEAKGMLSPGSRPKKLGITIWPDIWADFAADEFPSRANKKRHLARVPRKQVVAMDYSLAPARYVGTQALSEFEQFINRNNAQPLRELVAFIRPQALKNSDLGTIKVYEANIGDITDGGFLQTPLKHLMVDHDREQLLLRQKLQPGDVVFSIKGRVGAVGLVPNGYETMDDVYQVAGQSLMILRPRNFTEHPDIVLFSYLSHPIVQDFIGTLVTGTTSDTITQHDLGNIPVAIPSRDDVAALSESFARRMQRYEEVRRLRETIESEKRSAWPQVGVER